MRSSLAARALLLGLCLLILALTARRPVAGARPATGGTFVYVHAAADHQVLAYRLKPDGSLKALSGSPYATNAGGGGCFGICQGIAYAPKKTTLFTAGGTGVSAFKVAANGRLTLVSGSPFGANFTGSVATVQVGTKVYVYGSDGFNDAIHGYRIKPNGSLVELANSPFMAGGSPRALGSAAGMLFAPVSGFGMRGIAAFKAQADGTLVAAPGSPYSLPASAQGGSYPDPSGQFVYTADFPTLHGFQVNPVDASLTPLAGSPFTTGMNIGTYAQGATPLLFGAELSNLGTQQGKLQAVRRAADGTLANEGGLQDFGLTTGLQVALDPTGQFLALSSAGTGEVRSFAVDPANGALTPADSEPATLNGVNGMVVIQR